MSFLYKKALEALIKSFYDCIIKKTAFIPIANISIFD